MDQKPKYLQKKLGSSSLVQQVIDTLTQAMINKELRPGDRIPTEMELSESLGVGRLSIREAIKVLTYYGVLEIRRPEGTFVCSGFSDYLIDPMLYGIILNTDESYNNIKEFRLMMDVGAIKLAAQKRNEQSIKILMEKYDLLVKAVNTRPVDVKGVFDADNDFHRVISEMGGNPMINKINSLVRTLTHSIRFNTNNNLLALGEGKEFLEAHKLLRDAIINKQTDHLDDIVEHSYFYNRVQMD